MVRNIWMYLLKQSCCGVIGEHAHRGDGRLSSSLTTIQIRGIV